MEAASPPDSPDMQMAAAPADEAESPAGSAMASPRAATPSSTDASEDDAFPPAPTPASDPTAPSPTFKEELQPAGPLHLAAAGKPDNLTKEVRRVHDLLNPPSPEEAEAQVLAAAEEQAQQVLKEAQEPLESAPTGKKKMSAKEKAAEEEAAAARLRAGEERANEILAAAKAEVEEMRATRVDWREHLEVRALPYGWTPLLFAARHGSYEDTIELIEAGANVNVKDVHGMTPVHKAAFVGGREGVKKMKALLAAGADALAADKCGRTALHVAALNEKLDSIRALMVHSSRHGLNLQTAKDGPLRDGDTPIMVAKAGGLQLSVDALAPWEMRRKKMTAGATMLVPVSTPEWVPGPFAPRRFNANRGPEKPPPRPWVHCVGT